MRWAHLLCGPVDVGAAAVRDEAGGDAGLAGRLATLEQEVAQLRVDLVCGNTGA